MIYEHLILVILCQMSCNFVQIDKLTSHWRKLIEMKTDNKSMHYKLVYFKKQQFHFSDVTDDQLTLTSLSFVLNELCFAQIDKHGNGENLSKNHIKTIPVFIIDSIFFFIFQVLKLQLQMLKRWDLIGSE